MTDGTLTEYLLKLLGLAAIDSVNLLAFAVIAGLWLDSARTSRHFTARAAQFTGGAFCGIVGLSVLSVWVIGANEDAVRALFNQLWTMVVLAVIGAVITVMGLRQSTEPEPATVETPLTRSVLARLGLPVAGIVLGMIQSATSGPFYLGMVLISFADMGSAAKAVQVVFFALVAIAPSVALIITLSRVRSSRISAATGTINQFMARGRVAGKWLTIVVGVALLGFAIVRAVQIAG